MADTYDHDPPKKGELKLTKAPRPRELYWARFPNDAEQPEFWKERPIVVLSSKASLSSTVFVVPCTSVVQNRNPWGIKLVQSIDERESWAICDKPTSLAVTRLRPQRNTPRITEEDFTLIVRLVAAIFPQTPLSPARRQEILRRFHKKHGDIFQTQDEAAGILETVYSILRDVRD